MNTKKDLGQFFTTNSDYILSGFESVVQGKIVLDPFAGGGDLLKWAEKNGATATSGLDIDRKLCTGNISYNDSLASIPHTTFNITNPPYLAKNKMSPEQKKVYPMEEYEDMYLLSMKKILESKAPEGIIIIPVNFFSAENSDKLRKEFLTRYTIAKVNYFREQVFADTTYNVVAFHYVEKKVASTSQSVEFTFYPDKMSKTFLLEEEYDYRIAGKELAKLINVPSLKVIRLTEEHMKKNAGDRKIVALFNDKDSPKEYYVTQGFQSKIRDNVILLNCIDTNSSESGWIKAENVNDLGYECLVGKNTSRNIAYVLLPEVSVSDQKEIIRIFNKKLNSLRKEFSSLFLTNFRDNDRKRVSFEFCYKLIAYCWKELQKGKSKNQQPVAGKLRGRASKHKSKKVQHAVADIMSMPLHEVLNHPVYKYVFLHMRTGALGDCTKKIIAEKIQIILRHKSTRK